MKGGAEEDPGVAARAMEIVTALLSNDAQRTRAKKGQYEEHEKDLHAHLPTMRTSHSVVMRALVGNTLITTLKFGMFLRTGSDAMLSEAIHTLVDSCNQCILLIGLRQVGFPILFLVSLSLPHASRPTGSTNHVSLLASHLSTFRQNHRATITPPPRHRSRRTSRTSTATVAPRSSGR